MLDSFQLSPTVASPSVTSGLVTLTNTTNAIQPATYYTASALDQL